MNEVNNIADTSPVYRQYVNDDVQQTPTTSKQAKILQAINDKISTIVANVRADITALKISATNGSTRHELNNIKKAIVRFIKPINPSTKHLCAIINTSNAKIKASSLHTEINNSIEKIKKLEESAKVFTPIMNNIVINPSNKTLYITGDIKSKIRELHNQEQKAVNTLATLVSNDSIDPLTAQTYHGIVGKLQERSRNVVKATQQQIHTYLQNSQIHITNNNSKPSDSAVRNTDYMYQEYKAYLSRNNIADSECTQSTFNTYTERQSAIIHAEKIASRIEEGNYNESMEAINDNIGNKAEQLDASINENISVFTNACCSSIYAESIINTNHMKEITEKTADKITAQINKLYILPLNKTLPKRFF